ncbi:MULTISPECIES: cell envelope integrity protein TolA [Bacillus]|uniref:cell envelope integrity protein TolA n=1 Tax=Bacillus TaxID=1386 RepID=UPI00273FEF8F|nr:cell envelope integrity protein TolA [Bacillus sp. MMSF_3328]
MKQTDIFSMFNLVDEHEEKKKKEAEERRTKAEEERKAKQEELRQKAKEASEKAKQESDQKAAAKKAEEAKFEVNEETIIRHYGESIEITSYFTPEELAEGLLVTKKGSDPERKPLEPEMLRKRMEKDYPELVASHTEIIYLKEKNILVITMKAKKKGNCMEEVLSTDSAFSKSLFSLNKKIPFSLLRDFIAIARIYGELSLEVHGDIYYDVNSASFFLDIPNQKVHKYWVTVTETGQGIVERLGDAFKVLEIHSHHFMHPTPSFQDNESERVPGMLYGIIGRTQDYFPQLFLRQFISEVHGHKEVNPETVFEWPFYNLPEFDMDKIEVVSQNE